MLSGQINIKYWPELISAANYVRMRSPTTGSDVVPYQAWTDRKPNVSHLRIIGSKAFVKDPSPKNKWANHSLEGILCGYTGNHIYRVILKDTGRVINSNNVIIAESQPLPRSVVFTNAPPRSKELTFTSNSSTQPADEDDASEIGPSDSEHLSSEQTAQLPNQSPDQLEQPDPFQDQDDGYDSDTIVVDSTAKRNLAVAGFLTISQSMRTASHHDTTFLALLANKAEIEEVEPTTLKQAQRSAKWPQWHEAMMDKYNSLMKNKTWSFVSTNNLPYGRKPLQGKWIYKIKRDGQGNITRYKARWVVRGFEQVEGIDYNETYAAVLKPMSYKTLFAYAAAKDLEIEQMDVKTAFLYGTIDEEIYVYPPEGIDCSTDSLCKLRKALYGLKQAPKIWYDTIAAFLCSIGFASLNADPSIFTNSTTFIGVYVDDILLIGGDRTDIAHVKTALKRRFDMTDMGPVSHYLGMTIIRNRPSRTLWLSQAAYIEKIINDAGLTDAHVTQTPMADTLDATPYGHKATADEIRKYQRDVGSLMYAMLCTRPDIAYAVSSVSRYASNPAKAHIAAVKRIYLYLKGTKSWALVFRGSIKPLLGWTDAN
ncbi:gag-pol polyprotein [Lasallia pustulata]|uniref:Gag-pol polyprotein n=1 Tax=Lasallia pustulata TaxID=136370 RepID=A0A1W5CWL6_9LECA|nr:gag-pol polyprotein [Lasallia pustulata]